MSRWTEILDHGDDPGRYTLIDGSGRVVTCNENGSVVCTRKCHNPYGVVAELCRERGIKVVKPAQQMELLKKINRFLKPDDEE
ncbi:hypothetical protein [Spirosoma sp.]|uniref:hypothetical protein n=1 Tax=Spirosoma sp. TaxID=1899569 RepID=UPI00260B55D2|nr:hypothetical protein [Spirosoma sp.]MCX6218372.1 hypothetical protein [Spirosoma sp.]